MASRVRRLLNASSACRPEPESRCSSSTGLAHRHAVGKLAVKRVGELSDVAQGGGLAGPLGERVLPEAVLGCPLRDGGPPGPVIPRLARARAPCLESGQRGHGRDLPADWDRPHQSGHGASALAWDFAYESNSGTSPCTRSGPRIGR